MEIVSFVQILALDEISNLEDGDQIERAVRRGGLIRDGITCKAQFFIIYQTGRFGPQNGFRLALVLEGVTPEHARAMLKGPVVQHAAEYLVVEPRSPPVSSTLTE